CARDQFCTATYCSSNNRFDVW
nr:immunoglobulin heavy chain junction region [Macaca mulatta]MOV36776.1 immunoglobulin heavy chain junction region [Macaca mulatta]